MAAYEWKFIFNRSGIHFKKLKLVNRQGRIFYRDILGIEYPEKRVVATLTESQKAEFVKTYNTNLLDDFYFRMAKYPEERNAYKFIPLTYEEIIASLKSVE